MTGRRWPLSGTRAPRKVDMRLIGIGHAPARGLGLGLGLGLVRRGTRLPQLSGRAGPFDCFPFGLYPVGVFPRWPGTVSRAPVREGLTPEFIR